MQYSQQRGVHGAMSLHQRLIKSHSSAWSSASSLATWIGGAISVICPNSPLAMAEANGVESAGL